MNPEKATFIKEHAREILPTAIDRPAIEKVVQDLPVDERRIDALLERYETKVLAYERLDASPESRRVLLEASQPANYSVAAPLIEVLTQDPRCAGITLLTDNVAGQQF